MPTASIWLANCQTHAKVLRDASIDADGCRVATLAGITRHQIHIHEWRFTRFIEAMLRHHRVVPVQHLGLAHYSFVQMLCTVLVLTGKPITGSATEHRCQSGQAEVCKRIPAHLASP